MPRGSVGDKRTVSPLSDDNQTPNPVCRDLINSHRADLGQEQATIRTDIHHHGADVE